MLYNMHMLTFNPKFEIYVIRKVVKKVWKLGAHMFHGRFYAVLTNRRLVSLPISKLNSWNTYWLCVSVISYYFTVRQSCLKKFKGK